MILLEVRRCITTGNKHMQQLAETICLLLANCTTVFDNMNFRNVGKPYFKIVGFPVQRSGSRMETGLVLTGSG